MTLTLLFKYAATSTLEVHMLDDSNIAVQVCCYFYVRGSHAR